MSTSGPPTSATPPCVYPGSHPTLRPIHDVIGEIVENRHLCTSIWLDTIQRQSSGGESHHQGLARSHKLSDGSIYFFLAHSELNGPLAGYLGNRGNISQFRYTGQTDGEHVLQTDPFTVAPMEQLINLMDPHPSDIAFLPDVNESDAGYLFVAEEYTEYQVSIYRWQPFGFLTLHARIPQWFPQGGPNFVFIDKVDDHYCLGLANNNNHHLRLLTAEASQLFPSCEVGRMDVRAFVPVEQPSVFSFPPSGGPSQTKLVKDSTGKWSLLAFRSDPNDDPNGTDYVDIYPVSFSPFQIHARSSITHVFFRSGETGFASTGTYYVEKSGRLLLSTSYRWAHDEGPGGSGFVSRVDECPSGRPG